MRPGAMLLAFFFTVCALALAVWLGNSGGASTSVREAGTAPQSEPHDPDGPPISRTGPHPKVVVDEPEFNFGTMPVGEERTHVFVIRNEGEAPLSLQKGETTCRCTVGVLKDGAVPSGGSVEVALTWKPESATPEFRQGAMLLTNDPERQQVRLTLTGTVADFVTVVPSYEWNIGAIREHEPSEVAGTVFSMVLDDFRIADIETSNPLLNAEAVPLDEERLQKLRAKSGYLVRATLDPGVPIGRFREQLTLHTVAADGARSVQTLAVTGHRDGPVRILPTPGVDWIAEAMALVLGTFPAAEGKSATLLMLVSVPEGHDFQILDIESEEEFLRLTVEKDERAGSPSVQRFRLTFEVPSGGPAIARVRREAVKVRLQTNHPDMPELLFKVELVSI